MGILGATFDKVSALFERRFVVAALFPMLVFWILLATVILGSRGELAPVLRTLGDQQFSVTLLEAIGLVIWVTFTAVVLDSLELQMLRLAEGYWTFPFGEWLAERGRRWYRARLVSLRETSRNDPSEEARARAYAQIYRGYPHLDLLHLVMPTRIGNILRSMEQYPRSRYSIEPVVLWPRLYMLLPDVVRQGLGATRSVLDGAVAVTFVAMLFALTVGVYGLLAPVDWLLFVLASGGAVLISIMAHEAAIGSADTYAEQVRSAFDLYRTEVPKQLRMPLPATSTEEKPYWEELCKFLYRGGREHEHWAMWTYVSGAEGTPSTPSATTPLPPPDPKPSLPERMRVFMLGEAFAAEPPDEPLPPDDVQAPAAPTTGGVPVGLVLSGVACALVLVGAAFLLGSDARSRVMVAVAARDLPAYGLIQPGDLLTREFPRRAVASPIARGANEIAGRYPLEPLSALTPIPSTRLGPSVEPTQFAQAVALALPASPNLLLGGTLRPGEHVDIVLSQPARDGRAAVIETFSDVLVLDVRPAPPGRVSNSMTPEATATPQPSPLIILALPIDKRETFARALPDATVVLTRHS